MLWLTPFLTILTDTSHIRDTLPPVVVVATRSPSRYTHLPFPVSLLNPQDLFQDPSDLALIGGVIQSYGGVPWGLSTVQLMGSRSQDIQLLINGFPYHPPQGESPDLGSFPWGMFRGIEVLKGGASGLYGGQALVGVMNVKMRPLQGIRHETWYAAGQWWSRVGVGNGQIAAELMGGNAGAGIQIFSGSNSYLVEGMIRRVLLPHRQGFPQKSIQEDRRLWMGWRLMPWEGSFLLTQRIYQASSPLPDTSLHRGATLQLFRTIQIPIQYGEGFVEGVLSGVSSSTVGQHLRGEIRQGIRLNFRGWYGEGVFHLLSLPQSFPWSVRFAWEGIWKGYLFGAQLYRSTRYPTMDDLFWPSTAFAEGNPALRPEHTWGMVGSGEVGNWVTRIFWRQAWDLILWGPEERGIWRPRNVGQTHHVGVEVEGKWQALRFYGQWARHRDDQGRRLPYRPEVMMSLQVQEEMGRIRMQLRAVYTGVRVTNWAATRMLPPRVDLSAMFWIRWRRWEIGVEGGQLLASLRIPGYVDNTQGVMEGYPLPSPFWRVIIQYPFEKPP